MELLSTDQGTVARCNLFSYSLLCIARHYVRGYADTLMVVELWKWRNIEHGYSFQPPKGLHGCFIAACLCATVSSHPIHHHRSCSYVRACYSFSPSLFLFSFGFSELPYANFGINLDACSVPVPLVLTPVTNEVFSASVTSPKLMGQGMRRHTQYMVAATTSLESFPRKSMNVWRRYSDFVWLHEMLCAQFGGMCRTVGAPV